MKGKKTMKSLTNVISFYDKMTGLVDEEGALDTVNLDLIKPNFDVLL